MRILTYFSHDQRQQSSIVRREYTSAFALPTVLISAVVMFILLITSVSAVSSIRVGLNAQYFNQLGREAGESGVAYATYCLRNNNNTVTWTGKVLTPATDCKGDANGKTPYIMDDGNGMRTTFTVGNATVGASGYVQVQASGKVELIRTSSGLPWQSYQQSVSNAVRYTDSPQMSGGAGWQNNGHIGAFLSSDGQLYAYGANDQGQVLGIATVPTVSTPTKIALPTGMSRVLKMKTSGQGASFMCIIGDNNRAYCQGTAGAAENGLMPTTPGWQEFGPSLALNITDMSLKGYGPDGMCVLTASQLMYCAGENYYGTLGSGDTTYSIYKINNPVEFVAKDAGNVKQTFQKVYMGDDVTCGITVASDMYCAGLNTLGQIGGPSTTGTGNGVYATPIKYPIPQGRKAKDVVSSYHNTSNTLHVLATDGTIWGSGSYANGELGNGLTAGSTGASQTPVLFTDNHNEYATGSIFWNAQAGRCIDNNSNLAVNGNKIQLWDCSNPNNFANVAQNWVYGDNKQLTNIGTGMCLDDPGNSSTRGVALQLYTCNGTPAQQFELTGNNTIYHPSSGLCADAVNNGTVNGTVIQLWTCGAGNPAQSFTTWDGINGWKGMIAGTDHFCGIRVDYAWSGMWCAGSNAYGQLANVSSTGNSFLAQCQAVGGSGYQIFNVNLPGSARVDVTKLSSEWAQQYQTTMVIATNGKVYGSGRNQYGKLGIGVLGDAANSYRDCTTDEFPLPTGVTAVDMSTRDEYTTYVLGSDNKVYAAGRNNNGQIGDGTTSDRLSPVEVRVPTTTYNY